MEYNYRQTLVGNLRLGITPIVSTVWYFIRANKFVKLEYNLYRDFTYFGNKLNALIVLVNVNPLGISGISE